LKKLRYGVIGLGNMGKLHCRMIADAKSTRFCLTAACDIVAQKQHLIDDLAVPFFTDAQEMYDSGLVDAVIVATPHYWHAPLTFRAARKGLHVLCEKPLACDVGEARDMVAECRKRKVKLGVMFQQRCWPTIVKARQLIATGAIGDIFRVEMTGSSWFRTQAYYDSGQWRGTWDGEGGGVLINQAPHSLDLFQLVGLGLPKTVVANIDTREHKIEVEDTANIICDYGKGRTGYIYTTTAEEPGTMRLTVVGDKGTMEIDRKKLRVGRLRIPVSKHVYQSTRATAGGAEQKLTWSDVRVSQRKTGHIDVMRAFAANVLSGKPMIATGAEALIELELSNAAYISGYNNSKLVPLPVDAAEMRRLLSRLIRDRSTGKGGNMRAKAAKDMRKILASKK